MPGTHDSMSRHGGDLVAAQTWDLSEQLRAGIRVLDIRVSRTYTEAGDYRITFPVIDDDGGQGQVSSILRVRTPVGATHTVAEQLRPLSGNPLVGSAVLLLVDVARSAAIQAIADAERSGKKHVAAKVAEARALVAQGIALRQAGQFLPAVQKYQLAQRSVSRGVSAYGLRMTSCARSQPDGSATSLGCTLPR